MQKPVLQCYHVRLQPFLGQEGVGVHGSKIFPLVARNAAITLTALNLFASLFAYGRETREEAACFLLHDYIQQDAGT